MFSVKTAIMRQRARSGLTLIEILIALVMTLIVLVAMIRAFRYASGEIAKGRAMIELSNQLRSAQELMRSDFDGVTVDMRPWAITASPDGYFEYIEGVQRQDSSSFGTPENAFGDFDDIVAMTVRSDGEPYRGRYYDSSSGNTRTEKSNVAEVIWFCDFDDRDGDGLWAQDETIKLFRRALLVRPDFPSVAATTTTDARNYFVLNDVSARWIDTDNDGLRDSIVPNSLEDLAKRENRYAHFDITTDAMSSFPHAMNRLTIKSLELNDANLASAGGVAQLVFAGVDVLLADVIGFDVKVFSPNIPVRQTDDIVVTPSDVTAVYTSATDLDQGAMIDLGYTGAGFDIDEPAFSTLPTVRSQLAYPTGSIEDIVFDTFTRHYESNGIDDDDGGGGTIDEGANGLDDDGTNGVDDNGERETMPPYPYRLTGLNVSIRLIERTTQQVRQTSITSSFVPN